MSPKNRRSLQQCAAVVGCELLNIGWDVGGQSVWVSYVALYNFKKASADNSLDYRTLFEQFLTFSGTIHYAFTYPIAGTMPGWVALKIKCGCFWVLWIVEQEYCLVSWSTFTTDYFPYSNGPLSWKLSVENGVLNFSWSRAAVQSSINYRTPVIIQQCHTLKWQLADWCQKRALNKLEFFQLLCTTKTHSSLPHWPVAVLQQQQNNFSVITLCIKHLYALSACWGFVSVAQKNRLESIVRKAKKYGFLPPNYNNLEDLSLITDEKLFFSVKYRPHHVLKQLLPPTKNSNYSLRDRSHNLTLPSDISVTKKRNFIYRMLFTDIY